MYTLEDKQKKLRMRWTWYGNVEETQREKLNRY